MTWLSIHYSLLLSSFFKWSPSPSTFSPSPPSPACNSGTKRGWHSHIRCRQQCHPQKQTHVECFVPSWSFAPTLQIIPSLFLYFCVVLVHVLIIIFWFWRYNSNKCSRRYFLIWVVWQSFYYALESQLEIKLFSEFYGKLVSFGCFLHKIREEELVDWAGIQEKREKTFKWVY